MIKPDYCEAIDALRRARFHAFFPAALAEAIDGLSSREGESGQLSAYTPDEATAIITAFEEALRLLAKPESKPAFLADFEHSSLFQDYQKAPKGDFSFLSPSKAALRPQDATDLGAVDRAEHPVFDGGRVKIEKDVISKLFKNKSALLSRTIQNDIGQYLRAKDKVAFVSTSKNFFGESKLGREGWKSSRKLLQHVARGMEHEAVTILIKNPELLTKKFEVTDYSDRTFHNTSPWEYMLWAMDTYYMGRMMLRLIPDDAAGDRIRRECLEQYEAMYIDGGGIHYEQPATYKSLIRLDDAANLGDITIADIIRLFDTRDALLFWNNQFYYANKDASTITLIEPSTDLTSEQITDLDALKIALNGMQPNTSRLPSTLKEHQLINTLFRDHSAFQPTHHREAQYDFGIIDAIQRFLNRFDDLNEEQRNTLWMNEVAKSQRLAPAHVLQHYCDLDTPFYPAPSFKTTSTFYRVSCFNNYVLGKGDQLFSGTSLHVDLGFQFSLVRSLRPRAEGYKRIMYGMYDLPECAVQQTRHDLIALQKLWEVRTADAKLLRDQLHKGLKSVPVDPTGPRGPN